MTTASCRSDLAGQLKRMLTAREVAERYGYYPNRAGFIQCPLHQGDNHGSLKLYPGDGGWHCFGCNRGGDVIDFVMALFDLPFRQAALRLNQDFGLGLAEERVDAKAVSARLEERRRVEERKKAAAREYREQAAEYRYWRQVVQAFAPDDLDAAAGYIHPLYAQALRRLPALEYWLDEQIGG